jgi:hypothetical protein
MRIKDNAKSQMSIIGSRGVLFVEPLPTVWYCEGRMMLLSGCNNKRELVG